jgi:hypothetical protein
MRRAFEVEMVGLQGQVSLLELTTAQIDFEGSPALLVTGVEVIPTRSCARSRAARSTRRKPPRAPRWSRRRCRRRRHPAADAGVRHADRWARPSSRRICEGTSCI